jgi:ubiquitin carboxyl-terminal hydrolase 3
MVPVYKWLNALPSSYTAVLKPGQGGSYTLIISAPFKWPSGKIDHWEVFKVEFWGRFSHCRVLMPNPENTPLLLEDLCRRGPRPTSGYCPESLLYIPSAADRRHRPANHPYRLLYDRVEAWMGTANPNEMVHESVQEIFFPMLAAEINDGIFDDRRRRELATWLRDLTGGSVQIRYTVTDTPNLQEYGHGRRLISVTCVFPWAIDILRRGPNCLMADTTFASLDPYVLPVLHAIIANESIPIAFGISPSETGKCYEQMYEHIRDLDRRQTNGREIARIVAPMIVRQERGDGALDEEEQDSCENRGNADWPEDEETHLEEILANEPVESEWRAPVPETPKFAMVQSPNADIEMVALLQSLPLVSDMGAGLHHLVDTWHLTWKLCHRHIIEAIGVGGALLVEWACRLLQCYSREQWEATRLVILLEMESPDVKGDFARSGPPFEILWKLLGFTNPKKTHPLDVMERWALWERKGCPRTSNSAESVNGRLNAEIAGAADWIARLEIVVLHFRKRYLSRNTWCDRALKRNAKKCWTEDDEKPVWFSPERQEFYRCLHNATELEGPVKRKFPPEDMRFILFPHVEEYPEAPNLPPNFGQPRKPAAREIPEKSLHLEKDAACTHFAHLGWQIVFGLRKRVGEKKWGARGTQIHTEVILTGHGLGVPEEGPIPVEFEARWRARCWMDCPKWVKRNQARRKHTHGQRKKNARLTAPTAQDGQGPTRQRRRKGSRTFAGPAPRAVDPEPPVATALSPLPTAKDSGSAASGAIVPRPKPPPGVVALVSAPGWGAGDPALLGLKNFGATCFINSGLQLLFHIDDLRDYVASEEYVADLDPEAGDSILSFARAFRALQLDRTQESLEQLNTTLGKIRPEFNHGSHDIEESLDVMFRSLHDALKGAQTRIHKTFQAAIHSELSCSWCHTVCSRRIDSCQMIPLALAGGSKNRVAPLTLLDCLCEFTRAQSMADRLAPCCQKGACKKETFQTLPPVLILWLVRHQRGRGSRTLKINTHVGFPDELDMRPYLSPEADPNQRTLYQLTGLAEHRGSLKNGHYWACARHEGKWYQFNDELVLEVTEEAVHKAFAYLLVYTRLPHANGMTDLPPQGGVDDSN